MHHIICTKLCVASTEQSDIQFKKERKRETPKVAVHRIIVNCEQATSNGDSFKVLTESEFVCF